MPSHPKDLPPNPPEARSRDESQPEPHPDHVVATQPQSRTDHPARRTRWVFAASAVGAAAALTGVFAIRAADSSSTSSTDAPVDQADTTASPETSEPAPSDDVEDSESGLLAPAAPDDGFLFEPPGGFEDSDPGGRFLDSAPESPEQPGPQADGSTRGS